MLVWSSSHRLPVGYSYFFTSCFFTSYFFTSYFFTSYFFTSCFFNSCFFTSCFLWWLFLKSPPSWSYSFPGSNGRVLVRCPNLYDLWTVWSNFGLACHFLHANILALLVSCFEFWSVHTVTFFVFFIFFFFKLTPLAEYQPENGQVSTKIFINEQKDRYCSQLKHSILDNEQ